MSDSTQPPITCPCCRAANTAGSTCRRCKADLSLVFAVAGRRAELLASARQAAMRGDLADARGLLDEAAWLRPGPDIQKIRATVCLLAGDFTAALAAYHGWVHRQGDA